MGFDANPNARDPLNLKNKINHVAYFRLPLLKFIHRVAVQCGIVDQVFRLGAGPIPNLNFVKKVKKTSIKKPVKKTTIKVKKRVTKKQKKQRYQSDSGIFNFCFYIYVR